MEHYSIEYVRFSLDLSGIAAAIIVGRSFFQPSKIEFDCVVFVPKVASQYNNHSNKALLKIAFELFNT